MTRNRKMARPYAPGLIVQVGPLPPERPEVSMRSAKLFLAPLLLLGTHALLAQRTTATLYGSVNDGTGAVVPSAKVHATEERTGVRHDAVTKERGDFAMP